MATKIIAALFVFLVALAFTMARQRRHLSPQCTFDQIMSMPGIAEALLAITNGAKLVQNPLLKQMESAGSGTERCAVEQIVDIKSDMSLEMRSLCATQKVVNYDSRRMPAHIPEVQCLCSTPRSSALLSQLQTEQLRCEPVVHELQFLKFDAQCQAFEISTTQIAVACTAAMKSHSRSDVQLADGQNDEIEVVV